MRCGAPRVFEFQLMAPLISMIIEAGAAVGEWEQGGGDGQTRPGASTAGVNARAVNGAANWDMSTVAVFTCSRACLGSAGEGQDEEGSCSHDEELVVLVNEDACHTAFDL